jgi:glutathione synthase/RimK-type ligase-like ATP-grasp enzyme
MSQVLIVGASHDLHIGKVRDEIKKLGHSSFVLDMHCKNTTVSLNVSSTSASGEIKTAERAISLGEIDSIWWRLKPVLPAEYTGVFKDPAESFAIREWRSTLRSVTHFPKPHLCVNPLDRQDAISNKPLQLLLAQAVGFRVPSTAFSNDPNRVKALFLEHDRVIYKAVSWFFIVPEMAVPEMAMADASSKVETIYTSEIDVSQISDDPESVRLAPGQYQEYIDKKFELRVNIVGNDVFGTRINSQGAERTKLDWRHSQLEDMYEPFILDSAVRAKLLEFHRRAGLVIAAYDLIVTPSEETVFLECNPAGQWLWIEERLAQPISRSLARALVPLQ